VLVIRMAASDGNIRHGKLGCLGIEKGAIVGSHKGRKHNKKTDQDREQSIAAHQVQQVFSVREAAQFLQVSTSTVRRMILQGSLRVARTNGPHQRGRILIPRQALLEFLGDDDGGTRSVAV
jgi:excisionase family DNA binding protein